MSISRSVADFQTGNVHGYRIFIRGYIVKKTLSSIKVAYIELIYWSVRHPLVGGWMGSIVTLASCEHKLQST